MTARRKPVRPVDRDTAYDRVRFAYLAAACAFVFVAGYAIIYRLWFMLPVAVALVALTVWRGRTALGHFRRP